MRRIIAMLAVMALMMVASGCERSSCGAAEQGLRGPLGLRIAAGRLCGLRDQQVDRDWPRTRPLSEGGQYES